MFVQIFLGLDLLDDIIEDPEGYYDIVCSTFAEVVRLADTL